MFFFISFLFPWLLSILFSGVPFPFLFWNPLCRLSILCVVVLVSYYIFILETVYWQCVSISISTIYIMFCCRFPITLLFWNLFIYFYVYCLYCVLVLVSYDNLILESVFLFLCVPVLSLKCSGVGLLLLSYFGICISISMSNIYIMFWFQFPITFLFWNLYIYFYVYCLYCVLMLVSYYNLILESCIPIYFHVCCLYCVLVLVSHYIIILESVYLFLCLLSILCSDVGFLLQSYFGILYIYFYVFCLYCVLVLVSYYNIIFESVYLFLCPLSILCVLVLVSYYNIIVESVYLFLCLLSILCVLVFL